MVSLDNSKVASLVAEKMVALGGGNVSRHLEEILGGDMVALLSDFWCLTFLNGVTQAVRRLGDQRSIILTIGLPESSGMQPIQAIDLNRTSLPPAEATVYLFNGQDFLIEACEEYRRAIDIPPGFDGFSGVYRSWRSSAAEENGWNFSNDIYLWSTDGHGQAYSAIN